MRVSKWNQDSLRSDGQLIDRRSLKVALNSDCQLVMVLTVRGSALVCEVSPHESSIGST